MSILETTRRVMAPYIAAWVPLAALLTALLRLAPEASWASALVVAFPASAMLALVCLAVRYPVRGLPADRMPVSRLLGVHVSSAVLTTAIWLGVLRIWVAILGRARPFERLPTAFDWQWPFLAAVGLLLYLLAVTFHSMLHAVERSRDSERRALELGLVARDAEITLLRAQVDPHFLFNALNAIAGLTHAEPGLARELCMRLGGFLRAGLRIGRQDRIPMEQELALARDFLGVEQIRFGSRLRLEEGIDETSLACAVPPLILQPLLENAVRHGIAGLVEGGEVSLTTRITGSVLSIAIENPRDPNARSRRGEGLGLVNVRRRLHTLYGGAANLLLDETPSRFRVELLIPVQAGAQPSEDGMR
jgi:sensor histidine kinase YesM